MKIPKKPNQYVMPFQVRHFDNWNKWEVSDQETQFFADCETKEDAERLRDLLNVVWSKADPFERAKLIRSGAIDDQMPGFEEFTGWMQRAPMTWMPALVFKAIEVAVAKKVFKDDEAMLKACGRAIDSAGKYTRTNATLTTTTTNGEDGR